MKLTTNSQTFELSNIMNHSTGCGEKLYSLEIELVNLGIKYKSDFCFNKIYSKIDENVSATHLPSYCIKIFITLATIFHNYSYLSS